MRKTIFTFLTLSMCLSCAFGQDVIYSEEFDGGLGDWVAVSVDCAGDTALDSALWSWDSDGIIDTGASFFSTGDGVNSPTASNGAAIFNSDGLDGHQSCPAPHTGDLISPSFDFSSESEVVLSFYQGYRPWRGYNYTQNAPDLPNSTVSVSVDSGMTWTEFPVNESVGINDELPSSDEFWYMDISSIAANQSNVQIKFTFSGNYYFWAIDDIAFYNQAPTFDVALAEVYYPLSNYRTPVSQIVQDTLYFAATIANELSTEISSVLARVEVSRIDGGDGITVLYSDSMTTQSIAAESEIEIAFNNRFFVPILDEGTYEISYFLLPTDSSSDFNTSNNADRKQFVITENEFAKSRVARNTGTALIQNEFIGNVLKLNPNYLEPIRLDQIVFSAYANPDFSETYNNQVVKGFVLELPTVIAELSENENPNTSRLQIGSGERNMVAGEESDPEYGINIFSTDDNSQSGAVLAAGRDYLICLEYDVAERSIGQEVTEEFNYNFCFEMNGGDLTLKDYPFCSYDQATWVRILGAGWEPLASFTGVDEPLAQSYGAAIGAILSITDTSTSVGNQALPEGALSVYPNPAPQELNVNLDLDESQTINVFFADINGRILDERVQTNFRDGKLVFPTSTYVSGTYLLRVVTEQGAETRRITIVR